MKQPICIMTVVVALAGETFAAEWQWSVEVKSVTIGNSQAHPRAFLWIPPKCESVRGIVFGQNNMIEEGILEHREFRRTLDRFGFAEVYVAPMFDTWQNTTNNDTTNEKFNALLNTLAAESGYEELACAPIIPMGHSAMASFPWNFAAWNPKRTLAILSLKGDAPQTTLTGNGRPNADWGTRNIDGIPGVMVMDEYEWLEERLAPAFKFRSKFPSAPIAMFTEPGRGHFDYSDELVEYLTIFIRKAAEQRLLQNDPILRTVAPHSGWLIDRWRQDRKPHAKTATFARYSGNQNEAFWTFDRESARFTERFCDRHRGKRPQLLGFVQDGKVVPQTDTHFQIALKFVPESDGVTFSLATTFLDSVDGGSKNCSRWTGLPAGSPLGHAASGGPIRISRITGPVAQLSDNTFAVRFNRFSIPEDRRAGDIWLLAEHPGDARFKSAVQQALTRIPVKLTEGAEQRITFPEIPDQPVGARRVKLGATSDAGVPIYYYVREGPAEIDRDALKFTPIPPRTKFPVKVTVVAWQYGRAIEPKLKTAEPVERSFLITK